MKGFLIKLIELYQSSPLKMHSKCRFTPTCSEYMKQSIIIHGVWRGIFLGTKRIFRCRPFGKYGYDPVNEKL